MIEERTLWCFFRLKKKVFFNVNFERHRRLSLNHIVFYFNFKRKCFKREYFLKTLMNNHCSLQDG